VDSIFILIHSMVFIKYKDIILQIEVGRIDPTKIIGHKMKLDEGSKGYQNFDKKTDVTKIVLKP